MSALPPPSRRVLAELGDTYAALHPTKAAPASSVQGALAELVSLLNAQAITFAVRDRVERAFIQHPRFVRSGKLAEVEARERRLASRIDEVAVALLLAPVSRPTDLCIKVGVLIATNEAGLADRANFPGAYLRVLLADLDQCAQRTEI